MEDEAYYANLRIRMVNDQIITRGIRDRRLLDALSELPRHWFVPQEYANIAYSDSPLPIGRGQTISQPYIVALMTELLLLKGRKTCWKSGRVQAIKPLCSLHLLATSIPSNGMQHWLKMHKRP